MSGFSLDHRIVLTIHPHQECIRREGEVEERVTYRLGRIDKWYLNIWKQNKAMESICYLLNTCYFTFRHLDSWCYM